MPAGAFHYAWLVDIARRKTVGNVWLRFAMMSLEVADNWS